MARAVELDYAALALTDECSLAGVVRAHAEAKKAKLKFIVGAHFHLQRREGGHALSLLLLAQNRNGYGNLAELITLGRTRSEKGTYLLHPSDFDAPPDALAHLAGMPDCLAILLPASRATWPINPAPTSTACTRRPRGWRRPSRAAPGSA